MWGKVIIWTISLVFAGLAGMGVGSGGVLVVALTLIFGYGQLESQFLNLIFFVSSSVAALAVNIYKKRLDLRLLLSLGIPGIFGAAGGAAMAHSIPEGMLSKGFGILMILLGAVSLVFPVLFSRKSGKK